MIARGRNRYPPAGRSEPQAARTCATIRESSSTHPVAGSSSASRERTQKRPIAAKEIHSNSGRNTRERNALPDPRAGDRGSRPHQSRSPWGPHGTRRRPPPTTYPSPPSGDNLLERSSFPLPRRQPSGSATPRQRARRRIPPFSFGEFFWGIHRAARRRFASGDRWGRAAGLMKVRVTLQREMRHPALHVIPEESLPLPE